MHVCAHTRACTHARAVDSEKLTSVCASARVHAEACITRLASPVNGIGNDKRKRKSNQPLSKALRMSEMSCACVPNLAHDGSRDPEEEDCSDVGGTKFVTGVRGAGVLNEFAWLQHRAALYAPVQHCRPKDIPLAQQESQRYVPSKHAESRAQV